MKARHLFGFGAWVATAAVLPAATAGADGAAAPAAERFPELHGAYYDMSVCEYCGLVSAEVVDGWRREVADLLSRDGLDEAQHRAIRRKAWTAADLEYGNRGLGGFRNWCRTEGAAAVRRFLDYRARALAGETETR